MDLNLTIAFGVVTALLLGLGFVRRAHRVALWAGAVAGAAGAWAAWSDSFWPMVGLGCIAIWCLIFSMSWVDSSWRARFGIVGMAVTLGFLAMWPTFDAMSGGKLPCPAWLKTGDGDKPARIDFQLVAGLDLQGGLRLVYAVEVQEAIKDKRDGYVEDLRAELARSYELHEGTDNPSDEAIKKLRDKVEVYPSKTEYDKITVKFKDAADADANTGKFDTRIRGLFPELNKKPLEDGVWELTVKESAASQIRERAVAQAREIILRRVDELGLREAAVSTRDEDIIVEVPGKDQKSYKDIQNTISQTARLEFKMLDDPADFMGKLSKDPATTAPEDIEFRKETVQVGLDDEEEPLSQSISYAYTDIKKGEDKNATFDRFQKWAESLDVPPDREIGIGIVRETDPDTMKEQEVGFRTYYLKSRADITGDMVRDAQATPNQDQQSLGGWYVGLSFTDRGGAIFDKVTGANVKRRFAIILDGKVESAPTIQTRISGGQASITMGTNDPQLQLEQSRQLELVLRSGALPAPITQKEKQQIGATLGEDSIRLAVQGALGGGVLVILFMLLYYRRAGMIALMSVGTNLFLQLAILATFGASMTLPGIAGLALTVGMGVDSNVLINERIREEVRDGKSPRAAVDVGYGKALSAIIDGHLTTLIAGIILAQYGTGPIKGFAVTLIVGTLTSIFCGVVVSRVLFDWWVHGRARTAKLDMG